jgi:hypothetical protein
MAASARTNENIPPKNEVKKFVSVIAEFLLDGTVRPQILLWEDGRKISIDQIADIRKAASLKSGGIGLRYTCRTKNKWIYLYRENDYWFMEVIS